MKVLTLFGVAGFWIFAGTLHAQGILVITQETRNGVVSTNQLELDQTHARLETRVDGTVRAFIYDPVARAANAIDLKKKTYTEYSKKTRTRGLSQVQLPQSGERARATNIDDIDVGGVHRRSARDMADLVAIQFQKSGVDRVGRWSCTKYEGFRGKEKVAEVCAADAKQFDVIAGDFTPARQLAGLIPEIADKAVVYKTATEQGFSGVPLRQTLYTNGKISSVIEIKEFRHSSFPASTFELPPGVMKEEPVAVK